MMWVRSPQIIMRLCFRLMKFDVCLKIRLFSGTFPLTGTKCHLLLCQRCYTFEHCQAKPINLAFWIFTIPNCQQQHLSPFKIIIHICNDTIVFNQGKRDNKPAVAIQANLDLDATRVFSRNCTFVLRLL